MKELQKLKERLDRLMKIREQKAIDDAKYGSYASAVTHSNWATCLDHVLFMIDEIEKDEKT